MNNHPNATAVYGLQFGDEGKGKIIDFLSQDYDIGVRCQGGDNAGHTIYVGEKKQVLHLIPSTILQPATTNVIGNGVVLNPISLMREIKELREKGIEINEQRLLLSDRVHLILPYHLALDAAQELIANIGTTLKGIGPAYTSKVSRSGIRLCDVSERSKDRWHALLKRELALTISLLCHYYKISSEKFFDNFKEHPLLSQFLHPTNYLDIHAITFWLEQSIHDLLKYSKDSASFLHQSYWKENKRILFEGAQGALLDIDFGTYPFVTSSNTGVAGIRTGSGLEVPFNRNIGIAKAYTTRVGGGPFPTELSDETGEYLQTKGNEFGATTGRKRRCGWLDLVALKYAVILNNPTEIALTKLDVLDELDEIKVCTAYSTHGITIENFPAGIDQLYQCKPVYESFPGWKQNIGDMSSYEQLPGKTRDFLTFIERYLQKPIVIISLGKERNQTITRTL